MALGNLAARIATAVVLVPGIIAALWWHRPEAIWAIAFAATLATLVEYFTIALVDPVERRFGVLAGGALAALVYWWPPGLHVALPACVIAPGLFLLFRHGDLTTVFDRLGRMAFGLVYAGLLLGTIALLKRDGKPDGGDWVLLVLLTAWLGDTFGYFAGRAFGKKQLYPSISPGKTWAGAMGGLGGAFLAAVLANTWFFPELGWGHGAVVTLVGGMLGQLGDLVESMLKRSAGVKDSGNLLPGHGGMLDRVDAVLFIAPWMYCYQQLAIC